MATRSMGTGSYAVALLESIGVSPTSGHPLECSYSVVRKDKAPLVPYRDIPDLHSRTEHSTEPQEEAPQAPVGAEEPAEAAQPIFSPLWTR